jgi:transcriptional regulator of heat shock response
MKILQLIAVSSMFCAINVSAANLDMSDEHQQNKVLRLSEPVATSDNSETFGSVINTALPKVSMSDLVTNSAEYVGKGFQVETKVAKVCQKKGCFFIAQQGNNVMRVAFKDYSFFVPTDSTGKTVTLAGELIQKEMTAEQVAHFNQDMQGGSAAIKEGLVYEILANSVVIPKA